AWIDDNTTTGALKRAFADYKAAGTTKTQLLYWNGPNHGGKLKDENGERTGKALSAVIYPYDVPADILTDVNDTWNYFAADPIEGGSVRIPYYCVTATDYIPDLAVTLNGQNLSSFSISDVWDDGSEYYYKFPLTSSAFNTLSSSNTIAYQWASGPGKPTDFDIEIAG